MPSRLNVRPAFLPYFRFAWTIPAALASVIAALMYFGVNVPLPGTIMLVVIVICSLMSNQLSGLLSGLSLAALGAYVYLAQIGSPPHVESLSSLLVGSLVAIALGLFLGKVRETLEAALDELRQQSDRVATENVSLSKQVDEDSEALDAFRHRLGDSQDQLRNATRRLIDAQESERRGLAKELHDDIGQSLTALRINLESNKRNFSQDATSLKFIETSYGLVDEIIASVRELSLTLRPSLLDDLGLIAALRDYVGRQLGRADIAFDFEVSGSDRAIEPTHSIAAYRIVQEIIANIIKHSFADHVDIVLSVDSDNLRIIIKDNGVGFDVDLSKSEQVGLASVSERASLLRGSVDITSVVSVGTTVTLELPVSFSANEEVAA